MGYETKLVFCEKWDEKQGGYMRVVSSVDLCKASYENALGDLINELHAKSDKKVNAYNGRIKNQIKEYESLRDEIMMANGNYRQPKADWDETEKGFAKRMDIQERAKAKYDTDRDEDGYEKDKAKQIDDTRAFYHEKGKHLLDPETGLIQMGPEGDPEKYIREYQQILGEMQKDMVRIKEGKLPSWYEGRFQSQLHPQALPLPQE